MPKSLAAFIMGDKTKIQLEGIHLDLIYGRGLRFIEVLIQKYIDSGLAKGLSIENPSQPKKALTKEEILAEIEKLQSLLSSARE